MKLETLIILTFFPIFILSYTDVNTILDCYECIRNQGKIVCRDEKTERYGFCCSPGENTWGCRDKDFCSN